MRNSLLDDNPVYHDVNIVPLIGIERHFGPDFMDVAINAGSHKACFQRIGELSAMFTAPPSDDRC